MKRAEMGAKAARDSREDGSAESGHGSFRRREPGRWVALYLRVALGTGFLSAVADRLGLWGGPGAEGVAWGSFGRFLDYTSTLNPWLSPALLAPVGITVTAVEVALGVALVAGWRTRPVGLTSGVLLLLFALGMTMGTGLKSTLDASVFTASAAGLALSVLDGGAFSVDGRREPEGAQQGPVIRA